MRLYIAGLYTSHFGVGNSLYNRLSPNARALRDYVKYYLESYHFIKKGNYVDRIRKGGYQIFLDSGAFSAFTSGVHVSLNQYAEFVLEHRDIIEIASVLDAIGDPEQTFYNQQDLEKLGCNVLPCFHYGEPTDLLDYYVKKYDYITLGGMVPISNGPLEIWLDELWQEHLTDEHGIAKLKVHGFGMTARKLMTKYPWYSVDSSSWIQMAAHGNVVFPELDKAISLSARSPSRKQLGQHYTTMTPSEQKVVDQLLEYYGLELREVADIHDGRWALNAFSFSRLGDILGEEHHKKPFDSARRFLF